jgi:hypothetical protein
MPELTEDQVKKIVADTIKSSLQEAVTPLVADAVKSTLGETLKPFTTKMGEIESNQKVLSDTLAKLPPAGAGGAGGAGDKKEGAGAAAQPLTLEAATKLVTDAIAADRQQQQQTAEQRQKIAAFIGSPDSGLARIAPLAKSLGFDISGQLTGDPEKDKAKAKEIAAGWEAYAKENKIALPDVGGGARDGGNPAGAGGGAENAAKPGSWIKMPA